MQKIITVFLMSFHLLAFNITFDEMQKDLNREGLWNLTSTKEHNIKAILDCQSFFHKFDFIDQDSGEILENVLDPYECRVLYEFSISCLEKYESVCFNTQDILNLECQCE